MYSNQKMEKVWKIIDVKIRERERKHGENKDRKERGKKIKRQETQEGEINKVDEKKKVIGMEQCIGIGIGNGTNGVWEGK